ncbi:MAG TPA: hypothetical protein DCQ84_05580 [Candidatus Competibacteraceae bacterium]|nr:hypothetical protein [Candidatus Competibacteraceae bacterium]
MSAWTPERRAKQAALIHTWKPWERSTGPRTAEGKAVASRNSWKHGGRSREMREWNKALAHMRRTLRELAERS